MAEPSYHNEHTGAGPAACEGSIASGSGEAAPLSSAGVCNASQGMQIHLRASRSASAPASPALRPVPRAPAPQAGWRWRWRWEQGAKAAPLTPPGHGAGSVARPPGSCCTPRGAFPPAPGRFPKRNEEMLSFATAVMDVSLKYPAEGGGCFRAAPQLQLQETVDVTGAASRTRGRPAWLCHRCSRDLGHIPGCQPPSQALCSGQHPRVAGRVTSGLPAATDVTAGHQNC